MEFSKKWTNMLLFNKRSFLKTKTYYGDQNDYISRMRLNQVCFLFFLFPLCIIAQEFNVEEFLNGQWCDKEKSDCFSIIANNGLIIYETPTGDFRSCIEIISYDKKKGVIKWELIKTSRKTNSFKIISKNKVEFDNGNRRSLLYRQKNK